MRAWWSRAVGLCIYSLGALCCAEAWALRGGNSPAPIRAGHFAQDVCLVIGAEASKHKLPDGFFARLIWRESLFDPDAVSHKGAEGIAQFMPGTAEERGLADAFDPAQSVAASAGYLSDLHAHFGNFGLAAAAYNAGPTRIERWLSGAGTLPLETQEYVHFVTGHTAEDWLDPKRKLEPIPISGKIRFSEACPSLVARQLRAKPPETAFRKSGVLEAGLPVGPETPAAAASTKHAPKRAKLTKKPPKAAKPMPWGVQIAANVSKKVALAQFSRTKAEFPAIIKGSPVVVPSRKARTKGLKALQTVRIGAESRQAAEAICTKLRGAGGACLVVRN